jgi:hypothetical protein
VPGVDLVGDDGLDVNQEIGLPEIASAVELRRRGAFLGRVFPEHVGHTFAQRISTSFMGFCFQCQTCYPEGDLKHDLVFEDMRDLNIYACDFPDVPEDPFTILPADPLLEGPI